MAVRIKHGEILQILNMKTITVLLIHSLIMCRVMRSLEPTPGHSGHEVGFTLDGMSIHCKAPKHTLGTRDLETLISLYCMSLDCGE